MARAALHELEKDVADKDVALNIDNRAYQTRNNSRGIQYYDCIERVDNRLFTHEIIRQNITIENSIIYFTLITILINILIFKLIN